MAQANTSKDVTSAPSLSQWLEIDALDTLFFRDGKPFSLGEETWADGIFPPSMSVVYGALRTAYAVQRGLKVEQVLAETAALRITDFCFYERNAYFPLPADFAEPKGKRRGKRDAERKGRYTEYVQLAPFQGLEGLLGLSGAASSLATANDIWFAPAYENLQVEGAEGGLIAASDLEPYLAGQWLGKVKGKGLSQVVSSEAKIGIGRDRNTYTAAEGQLYRVGMRRPGDLRLRVQVAGVDFSPMPEGLLKLGGEGRAAAYRVLDHQPVLSREATFSVAAGGYFRLYLATPAICRDTWPPLPSAGIPGHPCHLPG